MVLCIYLPNRLDSEIHTLWLHGIRMNHNNNDNKVMMKIILKNAYTPWYIYFQTMSILRRKSFLAALASLSFKRAKIRFIAWCQRVHSKMVMITGLDNFCHSEGSHIKGWVTTTTITTTTTTTTTRKKCLHEKIVNTITTFWPLYLSGFFGTIIFGNVLQISNQIIYFVNRDRLFSFHCLFRKISHIN